LQGHAASRGQNLSLELLRGPWESTFRAEKGWAQIEGPKTGKMG